MAFYYFSFGAFAAFALLIIIPFFVYTSIVRKRRRAAMQQRIVTGEPIQDPNAGNEVAYYNYAPQQQPPPAGAPPGMMPAMVIATQGPNGNPNSGAQHYPEAQPLQPLNPTGAPAFYSNENNYNSSSTKCDANHESQRRPDGDVVYGRGAYYGVAGEGAAQEPAEAARAGDPQGPPEAKRETKKDGKAAKKGQKSGDDVDEVVVPVQSKRTAAEKRRGRPSTSDSAAEL